MTESQKTNWTPGVAPVAVVMLSLNEAHNMEEVLKNLQGWAQEVFLVDSYSSDETVEIALRYGVHVVQRRFKNFGDQWNYALSELPISAPWTMKVDPDERLNDVLKSGILSELKETEATGFSVVLRLWFMCKPLPVKLSLLRLWKTGECSFSNVIVNEHAGVKGLVKPLSGEIEHRDSPNLHHWLEKQNKYTTLEALSRFRKHDLAVPPRLWGNTLQRRMWFKKHFMKIPFRYQLLLLVNMWRAQVWRTGYTGFAWARLRVWARRMVEDKWREMLYTGREIVVPPSKLGPAHPKALQAD